MCRGRHGDADGDGMQVVPKLLNQERYRGLWGQDLGFKAKSLGLLSYIGLHGDIIGFMEITANDEEKNERKHGKQHGY